MTRAAAAIRDLAEEKTAAVAEVVKAERHYHDLVMETVGYAPGSRSAKLARLKDQKMDAERVLNAARVKLDRIKSAVAQHAAVIVATGKDAGPQQIHGMTHSERMTSVELQGVKYSWAEGRQQAAGEGIAAILMANATNVPKKLAEATREVVFTEQWNKHDPHLQKAYNYPGMRAMATGGYGKICVYRDGQMYPGTWAHESGHNLALATWGAFSPPPTSKYGAAQRVEPPVSRYGAKSEAEDFADACMRYCFDRDDFAREFPRKYAALRELLEPQGASRGNV